MKDIRKIKAWKALQAAGYVLTTYRFRNVVLGYGAALYHNKSILVDIRLINTTAKKCWEVVVDDSQIENQGHYTLHREYCRSRDLLGNIEQIKAGKIKIKTRYKLVKASNQYTQATATPANPTIQN